MHHLVRFWVVLGALLVGVSALGFLVMSFVFPDAGLFDVGPAERLAVTMVAVASFAVVVLSGLSDDGVVGPAGRRTQR